MTHPSPQTDISSQKRSLIAFLSAVPIALAGGLIGLGGAEFRLPVFVSMLRTPLRRAVALNLLVSLLTVLSALAVRLINGFSLPPAQSVHILGGLIAGACISAFFGAGWASKLSHSRLKFAVLVLLTSIGLLMLIEAFLPENPVGLIPQLPLLETFAAFAFGLLIGLVSSMLGVAGGELLIPTLVFAFGLGVKTAGTGAMFVSLPVIIVGLLRYTRLGSFPDRQELLELALPMGIGSVIGAVIGGLLVGLVPTALLKFLLGLILIFSAINIFGKQNNTKNEEP